MNAELPARVAIFRVESNCPAVDKPATLYEDTWTGHIMVRHPEVAPHLNDIEITVVNPDYAAQSLPGPSGKHDGNIVLINSHSTIATSYLHVFLSEAKSEWRVTSAIFSKNYHSDKIWD